MDKYCRILHRTLANDAPCSRLLLRGSCIVSAILCVLLLDLSLWAQPVFNLGNLPVRYFSKKTYEGGTQNWDVAIDSLGRLFVANNDGVLIYDGTRWQRLALPNGTIVRSVALGQHGCLYAGGQGEFGRFVPDARGVLGFQPLHTTLPDSCRQFDDVWDIAIHEGDVYFRSHLFLFRLHDDSVQVVAPGKRWSFMQGVGQRLFLHDDEGSFYQVANGRLQLIGPCPADMNNPFTAAIPWHGDTLLFTSLKNGIWSWSNQRFQPWPTPGDDLWKNQRIYTATKTTDGWLAIGTTTDGLYLLDHYRRLLFHLDKTNGLGNNTVLSASADTHGRLWLGLDNGIASVFTASAFTTFFPDGESEGTAYTAARHDGLLYFGTNTGLYYAPWRTWYDPRQRSPFRAVQNAEGQVWGLQILDGQLLAGLHEGPFAVSDGKAEKLASVPGVWKFVQLSPTLAVAGHYQGLFLLKKQGKRWRYAGMLEGFDESCRIMERDASGRLWVSHPYRGVFLVDVDTLTASVRTRRYGQSDGLPSDLNNYVFSLSANVFVATKRGVYRYDEGCRCFRPSERFRQIFGGEPWVKYLHQDASGNIWYITDAETGVLRVRDRGLHKDIVRQPLPELNGKTVGGFEFMLPLDNRNIFIASESGFIHFDLERFRSDSTLTALLSAVVLKKPTDSLLFGGFYTPASQPLLLHPKQNSLVFQFSATPLPFEGQLEYRYRLVGLDDRWSAWSPQTEVSLNNLPPGEYTFELQARSPAGITSSTLRWAFEIETPWYATPWAWTAFGLILLGTMAGLLLRQRRHFEKEKSALQRTHQEKEALHQQAVARSEAEIARLRNEKLQAEIDFKTKELANTTMHLVQKSELLNTLRQELKKITKTDHMPEQAQKELKRLIKVLEKDASLDDDWERFAMYFDSVHSDFLQRLQEQFPHLSPNDYKLCAYLRMNLSTKEIASLLNISVRGVEASRYRLRKRLGIPKNANLTEFLMKL